MDEIKLWETTILDCYVIQFPRHSDSRGFFERKYCKTCFDSQELDVNWVQCNVSVNAKKATFRGFHYQTAPHEEIKLVTCIKGKIQDAIVDVRRDSPTFGCSYSIELSEDSNYSLYISKGVAHGYLTIEDNTVVLYQVSAEYSQSHARGISINDPIVDIQWQIQPKILSERDLNWPQHSLSLIHI